MWWNVPVIPALEKLTQEDYCEFEASQNYTARSGTPGFQVFRYYKNRRESGHF